MARISGVDLPRNKRIEVALTYIFGIGDITTMTVSLDNAHVYACDWYRDRPIANVIEIDTSDHTHRRVFTEEDDLGRR